MGIAGNQLARIRSRGTLSCSVHVYGEFQHAERSRSDSYRQGLVGCHQETDNCDRLDTGDSRRGNVATCSEHPKTNNATVVVEQRNLGMPPSDLC